MRTKATSDSADTELGVEQLAECDLQHNGNGAQASPDLTFDCEGDLPPLVPEGDNYHIAFLKAERSFLFNRPKLYLHFEILEPAEHRGKRLWCASSAPKKFTPAFKYWRMWVLAANRRPQRSDRLSTKVLRGKVLRARVRTVTTTAKQVERNTIVQYSVVDDLLELIAG